MNQQTLKRLVEWLGNMGTAAQIYLDCSEANNKLGCRKSESYICVRVSEDNYLIDYMLQNGICGKSTDVGFGCSLVSYQLRQIMELKGFSNIERFFACLKNIIIRDSCSKLTYIDVSRNMDKSSFIITGYDECVDSYEWINRIDVVGPYNTRLINLNELCSLYVEIF